jgi:predicted nucleic acid-binding protein
MTMIIDASVAAKWFVRETLREEAMRLLDLEEPRLAPDWIVQEVAHVAFKKWRDGEIGLEHARAMVRNLPATMTELYRSLDLSERAFAIAVTLRHPVYDCLYIACAEMTDGLLITADNQLCKAVEGTAFEPLVQHLQQP